MDQTLFSIFDLEFTLRQVLVFGSISLMLFGLWRILTDGLLPYYFSRGEVDAEWRKKVKYDVKIIFAALLIIAALHAFEVDRVLYTIETYQFKISTIFLAFIVIEIARILDWLTSKVLIHKYYVNRDEVAVKKPTQDNSEAVAGKTVQYMVYTLAAMILVNVFKLNWELFELPIKNDPLSIRVSTIFVAALIFLFARLISWVITQLLLYSYYRRSDIDTGRRYAIDQLVTYVVYVIAIFVTIENMGIELTVLWGGIAALLVGIGLGLQDVFRDLVSGIILLSDRSVKVHDIVSVNGQIGEVHKIGLRTSMVLSRDETILLVPNSQLVSNQVINWTHQNHRVRFSINIGVAYGSDPDFIRQVMLTCVKDNHRILMTPSPFVRFSDFADSSLSFDLFFWSTDLMIIEDVKSELRFAIGKAFKEHKITIPFPQRDVWIKQSLPPKRS